MILNNSELSIYRPSIIILVMAVLNLKACRVQHVLRRVRACSHILSYSLKGWLRLQVRTSVTIPRLGIEFDEAVLNLVVLDSVQKVGYDSFTEL